MTVRDAIYSYIKEKNMTYKRFCEYAGVSNHTLRKFFHEKDISMTNFKKIISAIEYEIIVKPK